MRPRDLETLELPRVLEAVAGHARSAIGHAAVLARRPSVDRGEAEHRLDLVTDLLAAAAEHGHLPMADIPPLGPILAAAAPRGAALEARRLAEVGDVLTVGRNVRTYLSRAPERLPHLAAFSITLPDLRDLASELARALDERGQIREEASPGLAAARAAVREGRAEIETRLYALVRDPQMARIVGDDYITVRNGRYVVPVKTNVAWTVQGVVQDRSQTDETVFVEPIEAVALNNRLMLAMRDEEHEERLVRMALTDAVRTEAAALATLEHVLAEIDALAASAAFASVHHCTRPILGANEVLLRNARHPLLLAAERHAVPIDLLLPPGHRGLAITGPNAGGKTVALKTLGLAIAMAQAGLFVTADEGCRLPFVDAILTDIGDDQSIERDLSTFGAHAANLAVIAPSTGPATLVLLDEPGAGTDPAQGAALAVGILTDLLDRGPLVAFTTHFAQVKTYALGESRVDVAAFHVDPTTGTPTFRLTYHSVGESFALAIARRHGVPERALTIAEQLLSGESLDLSRALIRLEETRRALDAQREAVAVERERLAAARAEAERMVAEHRDRKREARAEGLEESRRWLRGLTERGEAMLETLRQRPEPTVLRTFVRAAKAEVAALDEPAPEATASRPAKVGDQVQVVGSDIRGTLVELGGERSRIQRGSLRFEVATRQLRVVGDEAPRARAEPWAEASTPPTVEVNLVGRRARDAIDALDGFLDRAMRTGQAEVRVVHGLGTGALRRAIHEYLGTCPYASGYHAAEPHAGGGAVTVVVLRD